MDAEIPGTRRIWPARSKRTTQRLCRSESLYSTIRTGEHYAKKVFGNLDAGGAKEKFAMIKELADGSNIRALCELLKVSRSGYYAYLKRGETDRDEHCKILIQAVYDRYEGKYGYRQLQLFLLRDHHVWWNHKKVLRLMQVMGLQAKIRRKRVVTIPPLLVVDASPITS
ncbi:hypothetical protein D3C74_403010 [compost metagenome]